MLLPITSDSTSGFKVKSKPYRIFRLLVNQLFVQRLKINSNFSKTRFWPSGSVRGGLIIDCSIDHLFDSIQLIYNVEIKKT